METNIDDGRKLVATILALADTRPHAAAFAGDRELSYAELAAEVRRRASALRALELPAGAAVAVQATCGTAWIPTMLAVLAEGLAYVPLDLLTAPEIRRAELIRRSGAHAVLTHDPNSPEWTEWTVRTVPTGADPVPGQAYVLFTSGSTGEPKGVRVGCRTVARHARAMATAQDLGPGDRVLLFSSPAFDVAVEEILPTLLTGGALVGPADPAARLSELDRTIRHNGVTVANLPSSAWASWLRECEQAGTGFPPSLRLVVVGSEPARVADARRWWGLAEDRPRLLNAYGTTETTVTNLVFDASEPDRVPPGAATLPIGRALPGMRTRLVPTADGTGSELWIGGALALGYLHDKRYPDEAFARRLSDVDGVTWYRTGDRVRALPDGTLVHLGRLDNQIKIGGVRIEPAEVEELIRTHSAARDAVVLASAAGRLAAVVEASHTAAATLRAALRAALPAGMLPQDVVFVDRLPKTPGGKTDRRAAAALADRPDPGAGSGDEVTDAWRRVLGAGHEPEADFFTAGGTSLAAARLAAEIRDRLGVAVPAADIMRNAYRLEELRAVVTGLDRPAGPDTARPRSGRHRISLQQAALLERMYQETGRGLPYRPFNLSAAYRLRGPLDVARLAAATGSVLAAHPALRSSFHRDTAGWRTVVHPAGPVEVPVERRSGSTGLDARVAELFDEPFRPHETVRLRPGLIRLGPDDHVFVLATDHLVTDEWSMEIITRQLGEQYLGRVPPPENRAFYDFVERQDALAKELAGRRIVNYWRDRVGADGLAAHVPLPFERDPAGAPVPARFERVLDPAASSALRARGRTERHSLFAVLVAAAQLAVAAATGDGAVSALVPHGNRASSVDAEAVGWFAHLVVHRSDLTACTRFSDAVAVTSATSYDAHTNAALTMHHLTRALTPRRFGRPRDTTWLIVGMGREIGLSLDGIDCTPYHSGLSAPPYRALQVELEERGESLALLLNYDAGRFDGAGVRRVWDRLLGYVLGYQRGEDPAVQLGCSLAGTSRSTGSSAVSSVT